MIVPHVVVSHSRVHVVDEWSLQRTVTSVQNADEAAGLPIGLHIELLHEIRTPLTAMASAAELLKPGVDADAALEALTAGLRHLLAVVARAEALMGPLRYASVTPTDLLGVVEETITVLAPLFAARQMHLVTDLPARFERVNTDPVVVSRILANLLGNAARHGLAGSRVDVSLRAAGTVARLKVANEPSGVASDDGWGVGLALSSELSSLLGGSIERAAGPGNNVSFSLLLPTGSRQNQSPT